MRMLHIVKYLLHVINEILLKNANFALQKLKSVLNNYLYT